MADLLRIGNAQGFWGDSPSAPATLLAQQPDLDYITLDYLSEVSMSIMAIQRQKNPEMGYAHDFLDVIKSLIPFWKSGSRCKVIANSGGLNPLGCARACAEILDKMGCHKRIGVVYGDDVLPDIMKDIENPLSRNLETGDSISSVKNRLVTANAYLGAKPIVKALLESCEIVITGRVADPSLTVAPCVSHFNWSLEDYNKIAAATVAGHLIECGRQVTGGISTNWLDVPNQAAIGFPFVEMERDGSFVITKPINSGGVVNEETVKEQILYEIGDPNRYLSPDATVSLLGLTIKEDGSNRVRIRGAQGAPPPSTLKVSATYRDGYKSEAFLAIFGRDAVQKAERCGIIVRERLKSLGYEMEQFHVECLGSMDLVPGLFAKNSTLKECVLRIAAADHRKEALEAFTKEIAPLVTSGPQGTTGYISGRAKVREVFGYWPCLIESENLIAKVEILS